MVPFLHLPAISLLVAIGIRFTLSAIMPSSVIYSTDDFEDEKVWFTTGMEILSLVSVLVFGFIVRLMLGA